MSVAGHEGRVLVTGGAGYIGSVTCRRLVEGGRSVVVLDDLSTGHADNVRSGSLIEGDVGDRALVTDVLRSQGITSVIHFAAKALVGESMREPALYDAWNRGKMAALLDACTDAGVRAFVFSSSCAVYGMPDALPLVETHPCRPVNPYGASKAAGEDLLAASGIPGVSLRYFNAAGGVPEAGLFERHDPETHLLPLALAARAGGRPLTIFGDTHPTPDGTCIRDYVHVADLAEAHLRALTRLESGEGGGTWNLGTGIGHSVREVLDAVARVTEGAVPHIVGAARAGDPPALVADAQRAARDLGWRASRSALDRIVADAWAGFRQDPPAD